jgi:Domain of unknown function (DUF4365)
MVRFPQRPASHVSGDEAVQCFLSACPAEWVPSQAQRDYGIDVRLEIVREGGVTGEEFLVQIKGRQRAIPKGRVIAKIEQPTINYWLGKILPVMIVVVDLADGTIWV